MADGFYPAGKTCPRRHEAMQCWTGAGCRTRVW